MRPQARSCAMRAANSASAASWRSPRWTTSPSIKLLGKLGFRFERMIRLGDDTDRTSAVRLRTMKRCAWARTPASIAYHDAEWGVPVHDDRVLFEFITLEGAQAGLSWETILNKRDAYRVAFAGFDPAPRGPLHARSLQDAHGQRRHRAQPPQDREHRCQCEGFPGSPARVRRIRYVPVGFRGRKAARQSLALLETDPLPAPDLSDALSKELKRRGFRFVGTTICYAFMQAVGIVNDHATDCFRYRSCAKG